MNWCKEAWETCATRCPSQFTDLGIYYIILLHIIIILLIVIIIRLNKRNLYKDIESKKMSVNEIDEDIFRKYLYTKDIPDPDLFIRTSGEFRLSNFLLWQLSYTELYVTSAYWPDFGENNIKEAIEEFNRRERRFGGRVNVQQEIS